MRTSLCSSQLILGLVRQGARLTDLRKLRPTGILTVSEPLTVFDGCGSDRLGNKPFHLSPILSIISNIDTIYLVSIFIPRVLSSKLFIFNLFTAYNCTYTVKLLLLKSVLTLFQSPTPTPPKKKEKRKKY